jgi:hypothetical protein
MNEYDTLDMLKERWMNMTHSTCSGKAWHTQHAQGTLEDTQWGKPKPLIPPNVTDNACNGKKRQLGEKANNGL